jgi:AcrR family transcriptional regulator
MVCNTVFVSPRKADPAIRVALIEAAAQALANQEPLSTRRLAAAVGASPMAVYTRFGSMDELKREVRKEGFARFAARLAETPQTRDPVVDLYLMARKYTVFALDNQNLYKVMFIEHIPGAEIEWDALTHLLNGITRCIDAGRFTGDPWPLALHGWAMMHGLSMIAFTGVFSHQDLLAQGPAIGFNLFVGFGDQPTTARRSIRTAIRRIERDPAFAVNLPAAASPSPNGKRD